MTFLAEALDGFEEDAKTSGKQATLDKQKLFFRRRVLRMAFRLGYETRHEGVGISESMENFEILLDRFYPLERAK